MLISLQVGEEFFSPKLQVRLAVAFEALGSSSAAVLTACKSSQPVRQKRPMRVTGIKTKWCLKCGCTVSTQWGRVLWGGELHYVTAQK